MYPPLWKNDKLRKHHSNSKKEFIRWLFLNILGYQIYRWKDRLSESLRRIWQFSYTGKRFLEDSISNRWTFKDALNNFTVTCGYYLWLYKTMVSNQFCSYRSTTEGKSSEYWCVSFFFSIFFKPVSRRKMVYSLKLLNVRPKIFFENCIVNTNNDTASF